MRLPLCFTLFSQLICGSALFAERPNFVWIVSEDNSKHYLKLFDEAGVEAPHIEALAAHGITYTRAFSNSAVCSVARTTLATGAYAPRLGTQFHRRSTPAELPEGMSLFYGILTEAGYYTTNNVKEDFNVIKPAGTWTESSEEADWRNRPNPEQPFFHMQTHNESHEGRLHFSEETFKNEATVNDPAAVNLPPYFPDTPLFRYTYALYLDKMQIIDDIVGETVAALDEAGVLEDTFIFYFGDHGGVLPRSKAYLYETGLHVPLVVRVPEKWKHLVSEEIGTEQAGFVNFIDFGPTVLNLAGIEVPEQMDGTPFLGKNLTAEDIAEKDHAFGYADRFDEKTEMVRSLRIGDWKYIRSYQPWYPDALQNSYRNRMLAYQEWRTLFHNGELSCIQQRFFEERPAEMLFNLALDPHEINNRATDPAQRDRLQDMRNALTEKLKSMPDLSLFPENLLVAEAMDNPVAYGQKHKARIHGLIDTANLMMLPFDEAREPLSKALTSEDPMQRLWAANSCAAFGLEAEELATDAMPLLEDTDPAVRIRAAEFLGRIGKTDPRETLVDVINGTDDHLVAIMALNALVYFMDHADPAYPVDVEQLTADLSIREIRDRVTLLQAIKAE